MAETIIEPVYFYILAGLLTASAVITIFAPRMFLGIIGLFLSFLFTGLICLSLNAKFIALFGFILCGLLLCPVIFIAAKKLSLLNFPLRLAKIPKIIVSVIVSALFCLITCLYVNEEFSGELLSLFNNISEKSADLFNFFQYLFPVHIVLILMVVAYPVITAIIRPADDNTTENTEAGAEACND